MSPLIKLSHVNKSFPARRGSRDLRGRGGVGDWLLGRKEGEFQALRDISLDVEAGESLGIIGKNGSGKSTLLSLIAGVTLPTSGEVQVSGRVASLLELGAGFNPVLTGRENIYLNAGLLGMRHAQVDEVYDDIVRFSGIGDFIDQPVETYSSGMYVRIGFSVAAFVNPDIFLADEVLAVGDAEFQRKCRTKIGELREQGKTIVFVSHDLGSVNTLCERVVLLDKGRMVQRETAQKTITYYLRQVGREKGVHTFSEGDQEALHCDGRISVFKKQEEVSAAGGFCMEVCSLGQRHSSSDAEWEVVEAGPRGCSLSGRMLRLPLRLLWTLRFEQGLLSWDVALELERACALNEINVQFFLPTVYTEWMCNDMAGIFPQIAPGDMEWNVVAAPEGNASATAVFPDETSDFPAIVFTLQRENPYFGLFWANTEYMRYSRVLNLPARFPEVESRFAAGIHRLIQVSLDMNVPRQGIVDRVRSDRILECGSLAARFERGQIRLSWGDREISAFLHVYCSMLIGDLWNDSQNLSWGSVETIDGGMRVRGDSRRFPFAQVWEITRRHNAIGLAIWLEVRDEVSITEYHVSAMLAGQFETWRTQHEEGVFPAHDKNQSNWIHCNRNYAAGSQISASGASLPRVYLTTEEACPQMRMTALNTSYIEHARVLQALRPSEHGRTVFTPGRHLLFSGGVSVENGDGEHPRSSGNGEA